MTTQNTWTPEQLKRFKEAHDAEPCQTAKDAIRRLAPEAFKEEKSVFTQGVIWLDGNGKIPYLAASNGYGNTKEIIGVNLTDGWSTGVKSIERFKDMSGKIMRNGKITLFIKNSMLTGCEIEEAYNTP